jgi:hypothetical protein
MTTPAGIPERLAQSLRGQWGAEATEKLVDLSSALFSLDLTVVPCSAADASPAAASDVAREERRKVADLLQEHRETLTAFVGDADRMVQLIAYLLRLAP